jgi:transposase
MIDKRTIFEIHRLNNEGYTQRQIAKELRVSRKTIRKYLEHPEQAVRKSAVKPSKLDPYKGLIDQFLEDAPRVNSPALLQKLKEAGFDGEVTILKDYLRKKRGTIKSRQPFIRFESLPGKQMQIDWGHFGSLNYGDSNRKLYGLAVVEAYSRMLYVHFTHSQNQSALHQGLLKAFHYFGGSPTEVVVDNMLTAVIEREGSLIRFNENFLDFLRVFKISPRACNPGAPYEKGKIERAIQYIRQSFLPLRSFSDLNDCQTQAVRWLDTVANARIHQTTGQRPADRFKQVHLRPLPTLLPDCRETHSVPVHKDFSVRFDSNDYTIPPWTIGKRLTLKADQTTVTLYHRDKVVATHPRCWKRKVRVELPGHREMVRKIQKKLWESREVASFASLGEQAREYLKALAQAGQPIKKNVLRLLKLKDQYGASPLLSVLDRALKHKAHGADYIENILFQQTTPQNRHQPVKLKDENLNRLRLKEPSLNDYDAYILKRRREDD